MSFAQAPLSKNYPNGREAGIDLLRILAIALVAWQHIASVCDTPPPKWLLSLDPGQIGVAIFVAIAGYLAISPGETTRWILSRLLKIYPAFWIATIVVLLANYLAGYKPVSMSLIASQLLGTGVITHGGDLVGVHFWFVTLILICYAIAIPIRLCAASLLMICPMAIAAYPYIPGGYQIAPFLIGCIIKSAQPALGPALAVTALFLWWLSGAVLLVQTGVVGLVTLLLGTSALPRDLPCGALWKYLSDRTYCFYLIHGPAYLGVASFFDKSILIVATLGTVFSAIATISLFNAENVLSLALRSLITQLRTWHIANNIPAIHVPDPPASSS